MPKLILGQTLGITAAICASVTLFMFEGEGLVSLGPLTFIVLSYGVMMFASSYVEEEQHFWYWSTTAWLAFAALQGLNRYGPITRLANRPLYPLYPSNG